MKAEVIILDAKQWKVRPANEIVILDSEFARDLNCVGPLDARYRIKIKDLMVYISERARIKWQAKMIIALAEELYKGGKIPKWSIVEEIRAAADATTAEEVYDEEDRIGHDVQALKNCIRAKVSDEAKVWVGWGATSYDLIDSSNMARCKAGIKEVIIPDLKKLMAALIEIAWNEYDTPQMGRTHLMHALPTTFGFEIAQIVNRLGKCIQKLEGLTEELEGKFSGAVGTSSWYELVIADPFAFEQNILAHVGLSAPMISTQIVGPEPWIRVLQEIINIAGVLGNLARNMRNLQRTEINECREGFGKKQVGSSTMVQKRNPLTWEQIEGIWKLLIARLVTPMLNAVSDLDRDLTNSISSRPDPEMLGYLLLTVKSTARALSKLEIDRERMLANLKITGDLIAGEPLQLTLAFLGHPDAHEVVRQKAMQIQEAQGTGEKTTLWELINIDRRLTPYIERMTAEQKMVIQNPVKYIGIAPKRAKFVCQYWIEELGLPNAVAAAQA